MGRRRHRRRTGQGKQRLNGIRVWAGIQPPVPMVRIKKSMLDDEGRSDAARPVTRVSLLSPYDGSRTFQASFIGLPNLNMRVLSSCSKSPSIPPTLEAVVPDPIALASPEILPSAVLSSTRLFFTAFITESRLRFATMSAYLALPVCKRLVCSGRHGPPETFQNPDSSLRGVMPRQKHCRTMPFRGAEAARILSRMTDD